MARARSWRCPRTTSATSSSPAQYEIPVRVVIQPEGGSLRGETLAEAYSGPGQLVESGEFGGLDCEQAIERMTAHAEAKGLGRAAVSYRLKDWLISRQRYWGTPIPVVYCEKHGTVAVPDAQLPVVLPKDAPFTGEGGNPLEKVPEFVETICPRCGGAARRETDTMDTFVDSSWYFYRYLSPRKDDGPFDPGAVRYWFPIDLYVGGIEHAILHLVYSRFWTKMMRDLGLVTFNEPVRRLFPQGMVHKGGEVMSKSRGNTVAPDTIIAKFGADTLRLYILNVAPPEDPLEWNDDNITGVHRFLHRVWRLLDRHAGAIASEIRTPMPADPSPAARALRRKVHQTILRVSEDVEDRFKLNTAVSALIELEHAIADAEGELAQGAVAPGVPRGARDAGAAAEPVRAARVRGDLDAPGPALPGRGPQLAGGRPRPGARRGRGAGGPGERQGARPHPHPARDRRGRRSGAGRSRSRTSASTWRAASWSRSWWYPSGW